MDVRALVTAKARAAREAAVALALCPTKTKNDALTQIRLLRDRSPVDFIRFATAQLHVWRLGVRDRPLEIERALHELQGVEDPRIQTGFLNQYAYNSILWAQYETAYAVADSFRNVIEEYRLTWARPHAGVEPALSARERRALVDRRRCRSRARSPRKRCPARAHHPRREIA